MPDKDDYLNVGDNKAGGEDGEEEIMKRKSWEREEETNMEENRESR